MHVRTPVIFCALCASIVFGLSVSAEATRLTSSAEGFRITWNPKIFVSAGGTVSCPVTLEGHLHSKTITKISGSLVGYITSAFVGTPVLCVGGSVTLYGETLPWHVRYERFEGTLPSIHSIKMDIVGGHFRASVGGIVCRFATTAAEPSTGTINVEANGNVTSVEAGGEILPEGLCGFGGRSRLTGTSSTATTQSGGAINVRLVA